MRMKRKEIYQRFPKDLPGLLPILIVSRQSLDSRYQTCCCTRASADRAGRPAGKPRISRRSLRAETPARSGTAMANTLGCGSLPRPISHGSQSLLFLLPACLIVFPISSLCSLFPPPPPLSTVNISRPSPFPKPPSLTASPCCAPGVRQVHDAGSTATVTARQQRAKRCCRALNPRVAALPSQPGRCPAHSLCSRC